ncbi:hypothetical protein [Hymenobacter sp. B81]|uniref:hypothetical protein n=1 Tax=Hymenobacter sp. B81 TaxID=3344878 RepID=UPI0037DC92B0
MPLKRLFALPLLPLLGGCASVYFPPPAAAPMLTQKGEFSGGLHANFKENFTVQGAYAPGEHIGLIATASSLHNNGKKRFLEQDLGEVGAGYHTRFGADQSRILEVYAGGGFGRAKRLEYARGDQPREEQDARLEKYFAQVNYTKKEKESYHVLGRDWPVRYGAALRLSYLNMTDFRLNGQRAPGESNIFFEPVSYTRIGLVGPLKFQFMSGWTFGLKRRKYLTAANSVFSFGFILNLGGDGRGED